MFSSSRGLALVSIAAALVLLSVGAAPQGALELRALGGGGSLPIDPGLAGIGPGSPLEITRPDGTFLCTANFVWQDGAKLYLGTAGHCLLPSWATATHGPGADFDASGIRVIACVSTCVFGGQTGAFIGDVVEDFALVGPVAYARQSQDGQALGNDFGLVEIRPSLYDSVRPDMPVWGGPDSEWNGPAGSFGLGKTSCLYGRGFLVGETAATSARMGLVNSATTTGFFQARFVSNGGDSGSAIAFCDATDPGETGAFGVLTHGIFVAGAVPTGQMYGTTLPKARAMATQAGLSVSVVLES